jgi:hypothetical protein
MSQFDLEVQAKLILVDHPNGFEQSCNNYWLTSININCEKDRLASTLLEV